MARIRSIHPGFFTDDMLVSTSMAARILFIGLGVEADDKGIFEWKPVTLKMRIFPADNLDVAELLSELEAAGAIRFYEIGGRKYGAIRNFRKYQKPKTPNDVHPINDEIRNYVGLSAAISEIDEVENDPFPPKGEKSFQMEDGGGKREEEKKDSRRAARLSDDDFEKFKAKYPRRSGSQPWKPARKALEAAITRGAAMPDILAALDAGIGFDRQKIGTEYIPQAVKWIRDERWNDHAPPDIAREYDPSAEQWRKHVDFFRRVGRWHRDLGPDPTLPNCRCPPDILAEFGYHIEPSGQAA